jgi:hypothetical protein
MSLSENRRPLFRAMRQVFAHVLIGKPASTFPGHAPGRLYCVGRAHATLTARGFRPHPSPRIANMWPVSIDPWLAVGVAIATATTDAVYVMFTSAVVARRRVPAATWSSIWYLLSSFAVISYTNNWFYVVFAAAGSWVGAYISMTLLHRSPAQPPPPPPLGPAPG